jgi:hypothetical protein
MNAPSRKIASLLATLTAAVSLSLVGTGCIIDGGAGVGTDPGPVVSSPAPSTTPTTDPSTTPAPAPKPVIADVSIDPGATMAANPGEGVGVYVEYAGEGHWTVFTTCDTGASSASCDFDLIISADSSVTLSAVQGSDLAASDSLTLGLDGAIRLKATTAYGMNGFSFDADPGATIELDTKVDGEAQPRFVYAISGGAVLKGVPSNPVQFTPAAA